MEDQRLLHLIELIAQANKSKDYKVKLPTSGKNDSVDLLAKEVGLLLSKIEANHEDIGTQPTAEVFILLNEELEILSVSDGVLQALGQAKDGVLGKPLASFLHPKSVTVDALRQDLQKDKYSGLKIILANADGDPITIPIAVSSLTTQNGNKQFIITGLHEAQKMPREGARSYRQIEKLTHFLHKTASEFKGPISSISGVVNLAKLESQDFKQHRYLDLVNKTAKQMDTIIRNIVTFCGNMEDAVDPEEIDFVLEITHLLKDLRNLEGAEMIKYNLNVDPTLTFKSDLWRVQIILRHLISNAIKYQNLDQEYPTVTISAQPWGKSGVELRVKDNGPGIAQEYQDLIFDMFFKATDKPQGAGLGLFITKSIIEKLGGLIRIESRTREGSSFIVNLPNLD